jgi:hypothetical protein
LLYCRHAESYFCGKGDFGTSGRSFDEVSDRHFHDCLYDAEFGIHIGRAPSKIARVSELELSNRLLVAAESKAKLGRQIVSNFPVKFRSENKGRFIAVTFTGVVLAVCDTLEGLNKEIVKRNVKENYYIERIGYHEVAQI